MNRREARQLDCEIREKLKDYSKELNLKEAFGDLIMDRYLEIIPDDIRRDMIFLGEESVSYKLGNAKLDWKGVLIATADFVAALSHPESIFQYLQMAIISILLIETVTKKELDYNLAVIVYALHQLNAYEIGISLEQLENKIKKMIEDYQVESIEMGKLEEGINKLIKWKVIYMEEGNIFMKETVWGKL